MPGSIHVELLSVFDVEAIIRYGGLGLLGALVFMSTGLFFCFFIPSGAVLFAAGIFAAAGELTQNIAVICMVLTISCAVGNVTGYWFGKKTGPRFYARKESSFFKHHYLSKTEQFYKKYGKLAVIGAFFLPIIRSFAPVIAGIVRMDARRFFLTSIIGSALYINSFILAGYVIARQPFLKPWLKYIVAGFILLVTVPLIIKIIRELKRPVGRQVSDKTDL